MSTGCLRHRAERPQLVAAGGVRRRAVRSRTYGYYACTRRNHLGTKTACSAPSFPADALEEAVLARVRQLSLRPELRQKIVDHALAKLGNESQRIAAEVASVQQRLGRVQVEINNLLGVLKARGAAAMSLVEDELSRLEEEQTRLRSALAHLQEQRAPLSVEEEQARKLIDGWQGLPELLDDATPQDRRVVLQHAIQVLELRAVDQSDGKKGTYAMRIFPEFGIPVSVAVKEFTTFAAKVAVGRDCWVAV